MTQLIRNQVYIARTQQKLLARLAKLRGVSKAEIIRQAIEREAAESQNQSFTPDATAFEEIEQMALSRRSYGVVSHPLQWSRDDVYAERLKQLGSETT